MMTVCVGSSPTRHGVTTWAEGRGPTRLTRRETVPTRRGEEVAARHEPRFSPRPVPCRDADGDNVIDHSTTGLEAGAHGDTVPRLSVSRTNGPAPTARIVRAARAFLAPPGRVPVPGLGFRPRTGPAPVLPAGARVGSAAPWVAGPGDAVRARRPDARGPVDGAGPEQPANRRARDYWPADFRRHGDARLQRHHGRQWPAGLEPGRYQLDPRR